MFSQASVILSGGGAVWCHSLGLSCKGSVLHPGGEGGSPIVYPRRSRHPSGRQTPPEVGTPYRLWHIVAATAAIGTHGTPMLSCYRPHTKYGGKQCFHRHLYSVHNLTKVCLSFPACITGHMTRRGSAPPGKADPIQERIPQDTVNQRSVRILLECILVMNAAEKD